VNITAEQRTQVVQSLSSVNITPVRENITVTVGQTVPTTVVDNLVACPQTLLSIITGIQQCRVLLVGNTYYIVDGSTRRVITTVSR
jgi:hypothetical protein